jgi:hypothetical protein
VITDEQLIDLIRNTGHGGSDTVITPAAVRAAARRRTRRRAMLASAVIPVAVAAGVLLSRSSTPEHHHRDLAQQSTATASRVASTAARPIGGMAPGCGPGFDTHVVGGYRENGTLATVPAGKPITIRAVLAVHRPTYIKSLSLVVGPNTVGTDALPALRNEHMFTGKAVNGQHLSATVTISTPGSYAVLIYGTSTSDGPCGGITSTEPETSSQPIGYLRVH